MKIESSNLQPQWWACDASTNVKMSNTKTNFEGSQEAKTTERNKVYIPIYRVSLVREKSLKAEYKYVKNPLSVYQIIKPYLDDLDREHFVVMMLDVKKKVIGINTVAVGILSSCPVHPREVFKPVIVANAAAVILVHNHRQSGAQPG
jgi:DNA repair protein RadC